MDSTHFYKNLPVIEAFETLSYESIYEQVPSDWILFASDVKNSTKQIENGLYKQINMVGAMSIVSILNLNRSIDIPFIFGGDGAFILVPPLLYEEAYKALIAVKEQAYETYALELRVGCISVEELLAKNKELRLAKYQVSNEYEQVLIKGNALEYFDVLLKKDETYHLKKRANEEYESNLEGLECRWQKIETSKDMTLSLLVKCSEQSYYKEVLHQIETILGTLEERHPIQVQRLNLSFKSHDLNIEASLSAKSGFKKVIQILKLKIINVLGWCLMQFGIGQWSQYKTHVVSTTDVQKFDDMLRMVFSATHEQKKRLEDYLEEEYVNKKLIYGLHQSKFALMTCLIFERHGKHIHFVDSSDGGYAMAAKDFKRKLNA